MTAVLDPKPSSAASDPSELQALLIVDRLGKSFRDRTVLRDVTFSVRAGETLAISGPSGTGKSTLLNCAGGLETPDSGAVFVEGEDLVGMSSRRRRLLFRDVYGHLFQNYALIEDESVEANLRLALYGRSLSRASGRAAMAQALEEVGLAGYEKADVSTLSGGEQQRVAVARLRVKQARLIFADEPTGALDPDNRDRLLALLGAMAADGAGVLVATHDPAVMGWAQTSLVLE